MTEIDASNVYGEFGKTLSVLFDYQIGYVDAIAHEFMFIGRNSGTPGEFDTEMICRSNAVVKNLFCEVFSNTFVGNVEFKLRKNGNSVNAPNPLFDMHVFEYTPGETGLKTTALEFNYLKDDFICLSFYEAEPNKTIRYRMGLTMEFDPI